MHPIEIFLREGFKDDTVQIRVNGSEAASLTGVTTKALLGLAVQRVVSAERVPALVQIALPRRSVSQDVVTAAPFLDVDFLDGMLVIHESHERHGSM